MNLDSRGDMELKDYIAIGMRWLWLFALTTFVAAASSWVGTRSMPPTYASQTTLMVGRATDNPDPNYQSIYMSQSLANTYSQMVTREPVLNGVMQALELEGSWQQLRGMVKGNPVPGTQLLEIRVIDSDPARAQVIANEVANQLILNSPTARARENMRDAAFINQQTVNLRTSIEEAQTEITELDSRIANENSARSIAELQNRKGVLASKVETWRSQYASLVSSIEGSEVNSLAIVEVASLGSPVGPNIMSNVGLAAALGFGLALIAVMVIEYMDDTIKTSQNVERRLGLSTLASVYVMADVEQRRDSLTTLVHPRSPAAEAYRVLRTNLQFSLLDNQGGTLVVTSPNPGEGKSTTAANLAVAIAQSGKRVVLVDTDLRRPSLHLFFDLQNGLGVTSLLLDQKLQLDDVLTDIEAVPGLNVLTSGPLPPNPAEVLGSERMRGFIAQLRERADIMIMDSPPLLVVTDGALMAAEASGTLLVLDCGRTRTDAAKRAVEVLDRVGVRPIGAVVNRLDRSRVGSYYYDYYVQRYDYDAYYGSDDGRGPPSAQPVVGRRAGTIVAPLADALARVRSAFTPRTGL